MHRSLSLLAGLLAAQAGLALAQDTPTPAAREAARRSNAFGNDLYRRLAADAGGNLIFSPSSISAAMGMAYAGAEGETRAQIQRAMHFVAGDVARGQGDLERALTRRPAPAAAVDEQDQRGAAQALDPSAQLGTGSAPESPQAQADEAPAKLPTHVVRMANRAWPQLGYPIKDSYLAALEPYGVGVEALDFAADPGAAKDRINAWVGDQTKNQDGEPMIPELLSSLDSTTKLVLTNAVYFRGEWETAFDAANTRKAPFHTIDGGSTLVDMMRRTKAKIRTTTMPSGARVGVLPYTARGAELVVVLPAENTPASLATAEGELDLLDFAVPSATVETVTLAFPKFELEGSFQLADALRALGITDAFSEADADLTGIAEDPDGLNLYVSKVVHKATATFNEAGAEAAAATAVVIRTRSLSLDFEPVKTFEVDRPFLFQIRDTKTGAVLFMGRVMTPAP